MTARCVLSADRTRATIAGTLWRETIGVDELPGRLSLYRRLRDRKDGAYAGFYRPTVEAIEKAMARAGMTINQGSRSKGV